MYLRFFNLREHPFNLTPDPRFLFLSSQHEEALSHLLYGIHERKGFIEITGEVGTGKTILCRALLDRLDSTVSTALIFNSYLTEIELLQAILSDFGLACQETTRKGYIDALNQYLLQEFAAGRNAMVLIDEAQNLEPRVLEQLRMLSNLETERGKLIQVILVGQPELRARLATPQMRQLDQRIAVRFHIHGLPRRATRQYIAHRLSVAGANHTVIFRRRALSTIYRHSAGLPRRINLLCDRILVTAYVRGTQRITARIVRQSLQDLEGYRLPSSWPTSRWRPALIRAGLVSLAGLGALSLLGSLLLLPVLQERVRPFIPQQVLALVQLSPPPPPPPLPQPIDVPPPPALEPVPAPVPFQLPEAELALARTLWRLKDHTAELLTRLRDVPLGSRTELTSSLDSGKSFEVMPIQVGFPQLAHISRPCFIEVIPESTAPHPVLWILVGSLEDRVLLYQEPEGLRPISVQQLRQIWYGKLYLTLEAESYRIQTLKQGMNGARVQALQRVLKDLGYFPGIASGRFGPETLQAVKGFQRDNQLIVDGQVGHQTLMVLLHFGGHRLEETT